MAAGDLTQSNARRGSGISNSKPQQPQSEGLRQVCCAPALHNSCCVLSRSQLFKRSVVWQGQQLVGTRVLCQATFDGKQRKCPVLLSRSAVNSLAWPVSLRCSKLCSCRADAAEVLSARSVGNNDSYECYVHYGDCEYPDLLKGLARANTPQVL